MRHIGQKILVFRFSFQQGAYTIVTLLNVFSNVRMGLRGVTGYLLVWLPYHLINVISLAKFCNTAPDLRPIEMFGYLAIGFIDA